MGPEEKQQDADADFARRFLERNNLKIVSHAQYEQLMYPEKYALKKRVHSYDVKVGILGIIVFILSNFGLFNIVKWLPEGIFMLALLLTSIPLCLGIGWVFNETVRNYRRLLELELKLEERY